LVPVDAQVAKPWCWISCRDIQGGANYADAIAEVIPSALGLVLVFSRNADRSDEIKKEVQLAGECKVLVVPFLIEKVQPSRAFAYELKTRQQIDAYTDWNAGIERLLKRLAGMGLVAVGRWLGSTSTCRT
jgi:TIR domain